MAVHLKAHQKKDPSKRKGKLKKNVFYLICFFPFICWADNALVFSDKNAVIPVNNGIKWFEDKSCRLIFKDVVDSERFKPYPERFPGLGVGNYWLKFKVKNTTDITLLYFQIAHLRLDEIELYTILPGGKTQIQKTGTGYPFSFRKYQHQHFILELNIPKGTTITCFIRVKSREMVLMPMYIGVPEKIIESLDVGDILFGVYSGIFLSMICYNLFLYFSIKDKIYLFYVLYIFGISFSQLLLYGYFSRFIFPESPALTTYVVIVSNTFVGIAATVFIKSFLNARAYAPLMDKVLYYYTYGYLIYFFLEVFQLYQAKEIFFDLMGAVGCILFYTGVFIAIRHGHRTAKILLLAWTVFFIGYVLFILRNEGILPYNIYTTYCVTVGSAAETVLLSFALADRINVLRKDNENKKNEIIRHLETNEKYLKISQQLAIDSERLKKEVLVTEFESLKNQVNPHFLFNSLNVLAELVYEAQEDAVKFISELANIYRYVLDCKQKEVIALSDELKFIKSYAFLLKIRFEENLNIAIRLPELANVLIPPITLQLLIENAIKHNIVSFDNPLNLDIYIEGDYLVIQNNIQLRRQHENSTGLGLNNIISRYSFLTNKVVHILNNGSDFIVKVPLLTFTANRDNGESISTEL
jgi:hypothetical protein